MRCDEHLKASERAPVALWMRLCVDAGKRGEKPVRCDQCRHQFFPFEIRATKEAGR